MFDIFINHSIKELASTKNTELIIYFTFSYDKNHFANAMIHYYFQMYNIIQNYRMSGKLILKMVYSM